MDKTFFLADSLILNGGTLEVVKNDSLKRIFSPIYSFIWKKQWYRKKKKERFKNSSAKLMRQKETENTQKPN